MRPARSFDRPNFGRKAALASLPLLFFAISCGPSEPREADEDLAPPSILVESPRDGDRLNTRDPIRIRGRITTSDRQWRPGSVVVKILSDRKGKQNAVLSSPLSIESASPAELTFDSTKSIKYWPKGKYFLQVTAYEFLDSDEDSTPRTAQSEPTEILAVEATTP